MVIGNGGEKDNGALPQRSPEHVGGEEPEAQQRIEIAQTAAGLDDLELVGAEIDDVAFEIDRDCEQPDEGDAELGGNELQAPGRRNR